MKRYLWTAVAVLFVNANASENPFALKENLLKIDSDQEILLSELGKIAEAREDAELDGDDDDIENVEVKEVQEEEVSDDTPVKMEDSEEQFKLANSIDELVAEDEENTQSEEPVSADAADEAQKSTMAESAQAKKEFEAALKIAQEKEAQERADQEKAEQAQAQKEADEKAKLAEEARETERREVAAYEKQRAEKLAKQAETDAIEKAKKEQEQAAEIDVKAEKIAAKESADAGYKDAVKEMGGEEQVVTPKPIVEKTEEKPVDKVTAADAEIDPEAEKIAAKEAADAAYLEAIREMDQED